MTRKETYDEYLLSQHWSDLRESALNRSNRKCEACGVKAIHGHHLFYRDNLADCTIEDIMALCSRCHGLWHDWLKHARKHVHEFCRQSTRGGILALLYPLGVKTPKAKTSLKNMRQKEAKKERRLQRQKKSPAPSMTYHEVETRAERFRAMLRGDVNFTTALNGLLRPDFKKFLHQYYKGNKDWNIIMANAFMIYDHERPNEKAAAQERRKTLKRSESRFKKKSLPKSKRLALIK